MKCENCGHDNTEYDIICENCGSPLNIEKNVELQLKYNHKQRAIDIEEMHVDNEKVIFEDTKKKVSSFLIVVFFLLFIILSTFALNIYKDYKSSDIFKKYDKFMNENNIGIIYIGNLKENDEYLENYSKEYEYNYLYINQDKITKYKKNKLKNKLKLDKIDNTVIIVDQKDTKDFYHNYSKNKNEEIDVFLQKNKILPNKLGKAQKLISKYEEKIKSEDSIIIYFSNSDKYNDNENILNEFCKEYEISYLFIDGNYLTEKQQLRLLQKADYNNIQDELIIIVDDKKILETFEESKKTKNEYFELFSTYGIIDSTSSSSLSLIKYSQMKNLLSSNDKNVFLLISSNCEYCGKVKPIIGKISLQNKYPMYVVDITKESESIEQYIKNIGYKEDTIVTPVILITEKGKILEYITGLSDNSVYEETFREYGIIR